MQVPVQVLVKVLAVGQVLVEVLGQVLVEVLGQPPQPGQVLGGAAPLLQSAH